MKNETDTQSIGVTTSSAANVDRRSFLTRVSMSAGAVVAGTMLHASAVNAQSVASDTQAAPSIVTDG